MKLGVLTNLLRDLSFDDALTVFEKLGIEAVEVGCGGSPGTEHADPDVLLRDAGARRTWQQTVHAHGMSVAALSAHANPVHPDPDIAARERTYFEKSVLLAEALEVDTIVGFSGCPGGCPADRTPNWVICSWPPEYAQALKYQWEEVLIPYWEKAVAFANAHGIRRIALEMHPGFCVYNPTSLLRLRAAVGDTIGANFDPSHLFWQGIDPVGAIRALRGAIYHVHAKDTKVDPYNVAVAGVLDTGHYTDEAKRTWIFRTVGYGHGADVWRAMFSELQLGGYDRTVSIEHEDSLMTPLEGLSHAVAFLKESIIRENKPGSISWA